MVLVNKERMLNEFVEMVKIPSHSKAERPVFEYLKGKLEALGFEITEDDAGKKMGGNCGNLFAFKKGTKTGKTVMLCAHMDTVEPSTGATVVRKDGILYSDGTTTLGGDDKSGVEGILEGLRMLQDEGAETADIQVVFTACEEGGLHGSRNMDTTLLKGDVGYALDGEGSPGEIVVGAPGQYRIKIDIYGKTSHGGVAPEKGINAIMIAAKALAEVKRYGRIDEETTCNIGIISGGVATNVVPDHIIIEGDARSRNAEKLEAIKNEIVNTIVDAAKKYGATKVEAEAEFMYSSFKLIEECATVQLAKKAAENFGFKIDICQTGGGSDANFINRYGVPCVILGTGMKAVHTVEEYLAEEDLYNSALWVYGILKEAAK